VRLQGYFRKFFAKSLFRLLARYAYFISQPPQTLCLSPLSLVIFVALPPAAFFPPPPLLCLPGTRYPSRPQTCLSSSPWRHSCSAMEAFHFAEVETLLAEIDRLQIYSARLVTTQTPNPEPLALNPKPQTPNPRSYTTTICCEAPPRCRSSNWTRKDQLQQPR